MRVIGLTGGIGSGKSTVGRLLAASGALVIDADQVAREVVEPGERALAEIAERFGPEVLDSHGRLDRPALASIVFADPSARGDLEAITHPRIAERISERIAAAALTQAQGGPRRLVVLEHPLLVETGQAAAHDVLVVVEAPLEKRLERLVERGMVEADAHARIQAQATDEERRAAASHVVDNSGSEEELAARVADLLLDPALQP